MGSSIFDGLDQLSRYHSAVGVGMVVRFHLCFRREGLFVTARIRKKSY